MSQNALILGERPKACVRTTRVFNEKVRRYDYTAKRRGAFERLSRCKCSTVQTPSCALRPVHILAKQNLHRFAQNQPRLNSILIVHRP